MTSFVSEPHALLLEQAISAASLRHKVIADNIANVNTPGFKRSEVRFEDVLRETMAPKRKLPLAVTHERHIVGQSSFKPVLPQIHTINDKAVRSDGNNVDIEVEMANMAKNTIYYDAAVQQLSRHFSSIKSVLNEGRR